MALHVSGFPQHGRQLRDVTALPCEVMLGVGLGFGLQVRRSESVFCQDVAVKMAVKFWGGFGLGCP